MITQHEDEQNMGGYCSRNVQEQKHLKEGAEDQDVPGPRKDQTSPS